MLMDFYFPLWLARRVIQLYRFFQVPLGIPQACGGHLRLWDGQVQESGSAPFTSVPHFPIWRCCWADTLDGTIAGYDGFHTPSIPSTSHRHHTKVCLRTPSFKKFFCANLNLPKLGCLKEKKNHWWITMISPLKLPFDAEKTHFSHPNLRGFAISWHLHPTRPASKLTNKRSMAKTWPVWFTPNKWGK